MEMLRSTNNTKWEIFLYSGKWLIALGDTHAAASTLRVSLENRNLNQAGIFGIRSPGRPPPPGRRWSEGSVQPAEGGLWMTTPKPCPFKGQDGASEGSPRPGGFRATT